MNILNLKERKDLKLVMDFANQIVALHRQLEDALVASMPFDRYIKPSMYAWLMPMGYAGSTPAIMDEVRRGQE